MKNNRIPTIVLAVLTVAVGAGWFLTSRKADADRTAAAQLAEALTNRVSTVTKDLAESKAVSEDLRAMVEKQGADLKALSSQVEQKNTDLAATSARLDEAQAKAKAEADAAQAELLKLDQRISGLQTTN